MNRSERLAKIVEAEDHKGEGLCSTRGDIWPHICRRTLLSVTNYPIQKKNEKIHLGEAAFIGDG